MFEALLRYKATKENTRSMWYLAGAFFFLVEVGALAVLFVQYRHVTFPLNATALALPLSASMPWFAARRLLKIHKSTEPERSEEAETNISYHLAMLVMLAYIALMLAITMIQVRILG
jgi:hypothetical protein